MASTKVDQLIAKILRDVEDRLLSPFFSREVVYKLCGIPYPLTPETKADAEQQVLRVWRANQQAPDIVNFREDWLNAESELDRQGLEYSFFYQHSYREMLRSIIRLEGWDANKIETDGEHVRYVEHLVSQRK